MSGVDSGGGGWFWGGWVQNERYEYVCLARVCRCVCVKECGMKGVGGVV